MKTLRNIIDFIRLIPDLIYFVWEEVVHPHDKDQDLDQ